MNIRGISSRFLVLALLLTTQHLTFAQTYYTGFEYLRLERQEEGDASRDLIYSDNDADNAGAPTMDSIIAVPQGVALSTNDLDFAEEEAYRAIIGIDFGCNRGRLEASYFWLEEDWNGQATLSPGDYSLGTQLQNNNQHAITVAGDTNSLTAQVENMLNITAVNAVRTSDLSGFEFNYIGSLWEGRWHFNPIFGIRGFSLREDLTMNLTTDGGPAVYTSQAENWLIGAQVGAELGATVLRFEDSSLEFNIIGKGGLAANAADLELNLVNGDPMFNPDAPDDSDTIISPFFELSAKVILSWGWLEATVGYEAVLIDNVELGGVPPDLFIFGADALTANDTAFYHGFSAGGKVRF